MLEQVRNDFPQLLRKVHDKSLIYLDSAATALKPTPVINVLNKFYSEEAANIHRGAYLLSDQATARYEEARQKVQTFLNAQHSHEIIFTRGTTESINLLATSFAKSFIQKNDEVIISTLEHHANIVPWQMICEEKQAKLKVIPISDSGELDFEEYQKLLTPKTRLVALSHCSNALGTINDVKKFIAEAHASNTPVLIDGAQSIPCFKVDVQELDCDFYAFSGHKLFGPFGIGVLYGKESYLNQIPPYHGGGSMIRQVTFAKTTYNELPHKFEAGTPPIAEAIGLGAAIDYVNSIGMNNIFSHEQHLLEYVTSKLLEIKGLKIIGTAKNKIATVSFIIEGIHPSDLSPILDHEGIATRTGHHCAQPLMTRYGISGTTRASFSIYNNQNDVDIFIRALNKAKEFFT